MGSSRMKGRRGQSGDDCPDCGMSTSAMMDLAMEAGQSPEVSSEEIAGAVSFCEWTMDLGLGIYPGTWRGYRFPDGRVVRVRVPVEGLLPY